MRRTSDRSKETKEFYLPRSNKIFIKIGCRETLPYLTDNREQSKREEEKQRREIATCSHSLLAVKCYYKRRDLYGHCGPSEKAHIDGSSARILSNDFMFTPWLSTLATF